MGGFEVPNVEAIADRALAEFGLDVRPTHSAISGKPLLQEDFDHEYDDEYEYDDEGGDEYGDDVTVVKKKGKSNPPSSEMADLLYPSLKKQGWRYDPVFDVFMHYDSDSGVWQRQMHSKKFLHEVQMLLQSRDLPSGYSMAYVTDICSLLEGTLTHTDWNDDHTRLAFRNGLLELDTGEFLHHSSDNYMTWGLDFDYDPTADSGPITQWIYRTQYGDEGRVQVVRAWLRACLVGRGIEIQRF
jgi:hypothetical protein